MVASHNKGKVAEIVKLLEPHRIKVFSATDMKLPEPEETGATFLENALIKSRSAAEISGKPSLADDSGLCVAALNNAPGIYSARWGGESKDFALAMRKVEYELKEAAVTTEGAKAHFVCVLALTIPDHEDFYFEGTVNGTLTFPARGEKGFGYDPIFVPDGEKRTFAEMDEEEKKAMSHRSRAFVKFEKWLSEGRAP